MPGQRCTRASLLDLPAELRLRVYGFTFGSIVLLARVLDRLPVDLISYSLSILDLQDKSLRKQFTQTIPLPNRRHWGLYRGLILACRQTYPEMERELLRLYHGAFKSLE